MNVDNTTIPDGEILYRYAKPEAFPPGQLEIPSGIFNDSSLSCDWAKYQLNPLDSFHIKEGRSVIIQITVNDTIRNPRNPKREGEIVAAWIQEIIHDPLTEDDDKHGANDAHALIKGRKKQAVLDAIVNSSKLITIS